MATELSQEVVVQFLTERGGRVRNTELVDYFKPVFPNDPEAKAAVRGVFKSYVDNVAFVKMINGVKCVCLKKKYRDLVKCYEDDSAFGLHESGLDRNGTTADEGPSGEPSLVYTPHSQVEGIGPIECFAEYAEEEKSPVSYYETDNVRELDASADSQKRTGSKTNNLEDIDTTLVKTGTTTSGTGRPKLLRNVGSVESTTHAKVTGPVTPPITVIAASPLPTAVDGAIFTLPEYQPSPMETIGPSQRILSCESLPHVDVDPMDPECLSNRPTETTTGLADSKTLSGTQTDSTSLTSLVMEDGGPITLDPLEHEWMMCASDGHWQSLQQLLVNEPSLLLKRDFITGFTCFHWAAKLGKPELLALIVNFAKQHDLPVDINAKTSAAGYTPLHLATLHDHMEVVKLLVGAYDADVEVRDHNGKKAAQYLCDGVTQDIQDIIGACPEPEPEDTENQGHRQRFSRVLQSNFMSIQMPRQCSESSSQAADPRRAPPLRRRSTLSKLRPKLNRISFRKQIVHSETFHGTDDEGEDASKSLGPSRPKSNLFG